MSTPDVAGTGRQRVPWEAAEVVAVLLAAAATVLAAGNLAAGLVGIDLHYTTPPRSIGQSGWLLVLGASGWETAAFLLLGPALALVWWEVDTWSAGTAVAAAEGGRHLARARLLALWLGLGLVAAAGAAVANWVPYVRAASSSEASALTWTALVGDGAIAACTLLAAGGGLYLVGTLVRRCAVPPAGEVPPAPAPSPTELPAAG